MSLPNFITVLRIVLVPVVVYLLITGNILAAFWIFVAAGVSDGVDGYVAKRFGQVTVLGTYLDPLADKLLLVSIYLALGFLDHIPIWIVILVVSRDLLIVTAVILSWMLDRRVELQPLFVSKANTVGQIVFAAIVLADLGFVLDLESLRRLVLFGVAALTVASAGAYLVNWLEHMARYEAPQERRRGSSARRGKQGAGSPGMN